MVHSMLSSAKHRASRQRSISAPVPMLMPSKDVVVMHHLASSSSMVVAQHLRERTAAAAAAAAAASGVDTPERGLLAAVATVEDVAELSRSSKKRKSDAYLSSPTIVVMTPTTTTTTTTTCTASTTSTSKRRNSSNPHHRARPNVATLTTTTTTTTLGLRRPPPIFSLPLELIQELALSFLDAQSLMNLARTCRFLRRSILAHSQLFTSFVTAPGPDRIARCVALALLTDNISRTGGGPPAPAPSPSTSVEESSGMMAIDPAQPDLMQDDAGLPPLSAASSTAENIEPVLDVVPLDDGTTWAADFNIRNRMHCIANAAGLPGNPTRINADLLKVFLGDGVVEDPHARDTIRFDLGVLAQFFGVGLDVRIYDEIESVMGPIEAGDIDSDEEEYLVEGEPAGRISDVNALLGTTLRQNHSGREVPVRRIYRGMRFYFSRSVHLRLPMHVNRWSHIPTQPTPTASPMQLDGDDDNRSDLRRFSPLRATDAGFHYFEVTVMQPTRTISHKLQRGFLNMDLASTPISTPSSSSSPAGSVDPLMLRATIGLVPENYSSHHLPGSLPGSVGYQSADGFVSLGHRNGETYQFGPSWNYGDCVGCGFYPQPESNELAKVSPEATTRGIIFFTFNGAWVGDAPHRIDRTIKDYHASLHACVGTAVPAEFRFNTGHDLSSNPFMYAPANATQTRMTGPPPHIASRWLDTSKLISSSSSVDGDDDDDEDLIVPTSLQPFSDPFRSPTRSPTCPLLITFPPNPRSLITPRGVQSPRPMYPGGYFEVSLEGDGSMVNPQHIHNNNNNLGSAALGCFIAVGVAVRPFSAFHHVGWDFGSVGFHSDDGKIFDGTNQGGRIFDTNVGVGDIVGVGMTPAGDIYFTANGRVLGEEAKGRWAKSGHDDAVLAGLCSESSRGCVIRMRDRGWKLHPTVSASGEWSVRFNFSGPFAFKVPF